MSPVRRGRCCSFAFAMYSSFSRPYWKQKKNDLFFYSYSLCRVKKKDLLYFTIFYHLAFHHSLKYLLSSPPSIKKKTVRLFPSCLSETKPKSALTAAATAMPVSQWDGCAQCVLKMTLPSICPSQMPCSFRARPVEQLPMKGGGGHRMATLPCPSAALLTDRHQHREEKHR